MAKGKGRSSKVQKPTYKWVTTSLGVKVKVYGIRQTYLDALSASSSIPQPPTYKVQIGTGDATEEHPITPDVLADESLTPEEKKEYQAKYDAWLAEIDKRDSTFKRKLARLVILEGLKDVTLPEDDSWITKQEFLGITVPEDELERLVHYASTEILGNADDLIKVMRSAMEIMGVGEEALGKTEDMFQRDLQEE